MNRYGLSIGILFTAILVFSGISLCLEGFALYKDVKWARTLANGIKGFNLNHQGNVENGSCTSLHKKLDRFSPTHPLFLGTQSFIFIFTMIYAVILHYGKNAGKLLMVTTLVYILFGMSSIVITIVYAIKGVATQDAEVGRCDLTIRNSTEAQHAEDFFSKSVQFRNFCFKAHQRNGVKQILNVKINNKSYSEADARKLGYCHEFGARACACLMGMWTGVMCLIVPYLESCCYPPLPPLKIHTLDTHAPHTHGHEGTSEKTTSAIYEGSMVFNHLQMNQAMLHPHDHDIYMDSHTTLHAFNLLRPSRH